MDGLRYIAWRLWPREVAGAMGANRSAIRVSLLLPLTVIAGLLLGACSTFGLTPGSYGGTLVDTISASGVGGVFGGPAIATVQPRGPGRAGIRGEGLGHRRRP